jgi:TolB-like protein/DNA-binding winged helix-turn-helix (wHTH) protein/Tfp pilus assembly protein PilF
MANASNSVKVIRFGVFELDLPAGELRKSGLRIKLQEQPFQMLAALLERPGELVSKEELRKRLWPDDTFVDFDHGLGSAINRLREALGDSAENPRFVETLPRRGYRFIAPVDAGVGLAPPRIAPDGELTGGGTAAPQGHSEGVPRPEPDGNGVPVATDTGLVGAVGQPFTRNAWRLRLAGLLAMLLVGAGTGWFVWHRSSGKTDRSAAEGIESLAVLPLQNLSGNKEEDYFAEGMTDELITDLGKISSLRVISRTSVMQYRDAKKPLPEIARELNVDAVVEGTVLRSGDRVRIAAQLIRAVPEKHLWAQSYERDLRDVLGLQGEVAQAIVNEVQIKLTPQERTRLTAMHAPNPEAQDAYLKGLYYADGLDEPEKAIQFFNQAIKKDPNYASSYVGLANDYFGLANVGLLPPREAFAKVKEAAAKAVALDGSLGDAHTVMGMAYAYGDWNLNSAERELRLATELSPNSAMAHGEYASHLQRLGKRDEAFAGMAKASALDPVSFFKCSFGFFLYFARENDKAIEQFRLGDTESAHYGLALAYLQEGKNAEAIEEFERSTGASDEIDTKEKAAALRQAYKDAGMRGYWNKQLQLLMTESKRRYIRPLEIAYDYTMLGEKELAFEWLEKAYEEHGFGMLSLGVDRRFDSLHSDPRFQDLLRRIGLPPS